MSIRVNSVRGVGCIKGFPYFATGLYEARETNSGRLVWKLVATKERRRTTNPKTCGTFDGAPYMKGIRHNKPVTSEQAAALTGLDEAVAIDKVRDMM